MRKRKLSCNLHSNLFLFEQEMIAHFRSYVRLELFHEIMKNNQTIQQSAKQGF